MRAETKCIALDAARARFRKLAATLSNNHAIAVSELRRIAAELGEPPDYDDFLEDRIPGTPHHEIYRAAESLADDLDRDAASVLRWASKSSVRRLKDEWEERHRFDERPRVPAAPLPSVAATSILGLTAGEARAASHAIRASCERLLGHCALLALPPEEVQLEIEEDEEALKRYPALRLFVVVDSVIRDELLPAANELEKAGAIAPPDA